MGKICIIIFIVFIFNGCSKSLDDLNTTNKLFEFAININEEKEAYQYGDTLWIETEINSAYSDYSTDQDVSINNASVLISCAVNKLYSNIDSLYFIDSNFNIIIENGRLELINVIDNEQTSYIFDVRYGLPFNSNKLKVGLILSFPGTFAITASGKVFYGENRTDSNDLTGKDEVADVNYIFNVENVNKTIFDNLPTNEYNYFKNIYTESIINSKQVYFIDIKN
ncbi:MAG: hypothetical protein JEZ09_14525 [Salinivirgaceae bacterium]|nr:hypothetical protein [Salinivirgaceae bacterium]